MSNLGIDLADKLERLQATQLSSDADIQEWLTHANDFKVLLDDTFSEALPKHIYWQIIYYLHDPDIRIQDSEYADVQNGKIKALISELRSGSLSLSNVA